MLLQQGFGKFQRAIQVALLNLVEDADETSLRAAIDEFGRWRRR
ncbi:hypothetical protein ACLIIZ_10810 [Azonexus caeni]